MNKPISFCCLSYNHARFIERCITSIWAQNLQNAEILVLDDGSNDDSVKILRELQRTSPHPMSVIAQENSGNIGANLNKLIKQAKNKLIAFISCDDEFIPNTFAEKISLFNEEQMALVYHTQIVFVDDNNKRLSGYPKMQLDDIENPTFEDILNADYSIQGSFYIQGAIFRKDIIDRVGGFDEDMICDDIILRTKYLRYLLKTNEYKAQILHKPGILYRQHDNNIHKNSLRQVKGVIQYLSRYCSDTIPPKELYSWIEYCLKQDNVSYKDKIEIFLNDSYIAKILKYKNYLNLIIDNNGGGGYIEYHKTFGIPYIFVLEKIKIKDKKIKMIKLFNVIVFKWHKRVK